MCVKLFTVRDVDWACCREDPKIDRHPLSGRIGDLMKQPVEGKSGGGLIAFALQADFEEISRVGAHIATALGTRFNDIEGLISQLG